MNTKRVGSYIGLFFLTIVFFAQAMEVGETGKEHKKVKTPDITVNLTNLGRKHNNNLTVSSRTDRRSNSSGERQHTPRTFQELEDLVRAQSTQSKYVFPKDDEQLSPTGDSKKKDDEKDSATSIEEVKKNAQRLAKELKTEIDVDPVLLAQAVLNVHKANKDNPLPVETEKYEKMKRKNEDQYEDFLEEVIARMIVRHQVGEEHVEPSQEILGTHVGFLRKHITKRDRQLLLTGGAFVLSILVNFALTTWGAYAQTHWAPNGTITG